MIGRRDHGDPVDMATVDALPPLRQLYDLDAVNPSGPGGFAFGDWLIASFVFLTGLLQPTAFWDVTNYAFVLVLLVYAFKVAAGQSLNGIIRSGFAWLSALLLYWLTARAAWSALSDLAIPSALYLVRLYTIGFVLLLAARSVAQVRLWLLALVCGTAVLAIIVLMGGYDVAFEGGGRFTGVARQENILGQTMTAGLSAGLLIHHSLGRQGRRALILYAVLACGGIVVSGSRGSAVTLASMIVTYVILEVLRHAWAHRRAIIAFVVFGIPLLFVAFQKISQSPLIVRMSALVDSGLTGLMSDARWGIYVDAWRVFLTNPIAGVGIGTYRYFNATFVYTHSAFMELLVGGGVVACLLYYSSLATVALNALRLRRRKLNSSERRFANAGLAVLVGIVVQGAFSLVHQDKLLIIVLFLMAAAMKIYIRSESESDGSASTWIL